MFGAGRRLKRNWNSSLCAETPQRSFPKSLVNIHTASHGCWSEMPGMCRSRSAARGTERLTQAPEEQSQHRACWRKKHSSHSSAAWSRTAHAVSSSICCNCHFKPLLSTKYKTSGCWFCTFETAVSASRSHSRP